MCNSGSIRIKIRECPNYGCNSLVIFLTESNAEKLSKAKKQFSYEKVTARNTGIITRFKTNACTLVMSHFYKDVNLFFPQLRGGKKLMALIFQLLQMGKPPL